MILPHGSDFKAETVLPTPFKDKGITQKMKKPPESPLEVRGSAADLTKIFDTVEFRDAYRVSYLANAIVLPPYDEVQREFGIIRAEYLLLLCLAHYPSLTAREVSRMTRRPENSISRAVRSMVNEGYLTRTPDPIDKRQARLRLSREGRDLHHKIAVKFTRREEEVLSALSTSERAQFDALLQKLVVHASTLTE